MKKVQTTRVKSINDEIIKLNQQLVALKSEKEKAEKEKIEESVNLDSLRKSKKEITDEIELYQKEVEKVIQDSKELFNVSFEIIQERKKISEGYENLIKKSIEILEIKKEEIKKANIEVEIRHKRIVEEEAILARQKEDINILKERLESRGREINKDFKVII